MDQPANKPEDYLLGTDEDELARLSFQHRLWSSRAFDLWRAAGFRRGRTILDLGAGPGFASRDLAELLGPEGRVLAVDASPRFHSVLTAQPRAPGSAPIEARLGDVTSLDLPEGSLDGAWARWVLCFVSDPHSVIASVARALRPGGAFAIQDYFDWGGIFLAPRSAAFERMRDAVVESARRSGGDFQIGSRLPALLLGHGFELVRLDSIVELARPGSLLWQWPDTFFANYVPRLVAMGLLDAQDQAAFERDWRARSADPAAFLTTPPMVEIVAVKR